MAKIIGAAGTSAKKIGDEKRQSRKVVLWWAIGILVLLVLLSFQASTKLGTGASLVAFFVLVGLLKWVDRFTTSEEKRLRQEAKRADRGAKAEETISAILKELPEDYSVLNDLQRVAGDIDHIVVGPTGLFVIETKAHGGKITVDGETLLVNGHPAEKDFINQVWRNAFFIRDLVKNVHGLEIKVQPIVVFSNAFVSMKPVKGVIVINKKFLTKEILGAKVATIPVEQIVELLKMKMGKEM